MPLLFNSDIGMLYVEPDENDVHFYRNSQADECVYVVEGKGVLETVFGDLPFQQGDYVVIHRNITHRWRFDLATPAKLLVFESRGHVRFPTRYKNNFGQLLEGAPFSERDIRRPDRAASRATRWATSPILVKQYDAINELVLDHHPLDVVGWDGYYYPWIFNINDFEPIVGRIHQPPPVHQTFQGDGFVICSFCPRPYDFDPNAVPAPYNHSNVDSDEVLFYASSEFMSRKGIEYGSITHHPDGLPHGPHPGRTEASIGAKYTNELAVMMDSFKPLKVAKAAHDDRGPELSQELARPPARGVQPADELRAGCGTTPRADVCEPVPAQEPGCGTVDTWTGVAGGGSMQRACRNTGRPYRCWQGWNRGTATADAGREGEPQQAVREANAQLA